MQRMALGFAGVLSVAILTAGLLPVLPANSQEAAIASQPIDQQAVEEIVRNYLLKNPEILIEVQAALEEKQKLEQRVASLGVIKSAQADIFMSPTDAVFGNPNGKTTVVEFYDYNCGFCKRAFNDMNALLAEDQDLRFVLKELPILGPDSHQAHIVSQAFFKLMPEKYREFHDALIGGEERATEESAVKLAVALGADETKLREGMKDPAIGATFQKSLELANRLSVTGTPSYVIGDEVVFGALGAEALKDRIAKARSACETAAC